MSAVRVSPEALQPKVVPHLCVVTGVPTDQISTVRAPCTVETGTFLRFGVFAPIAAAFGGIDVHLPFAPEIARRRQVTVAVMAAAPLVAVAALAVGIRGGALITVAYASAAAAVAAAVVRRRHTPELRYEVADDTVLLQHAHPAFVAALRR